MEKEINEAKKIIQYQVVNSTLITSKTFSNYNKGYYYTNENIAGYIGYAEGSHKALSVLSSGDHAFNMITMGVNRVDTFDINFLTEYIAMGLKRAMILKYNYTEYILVLLNLISNKISLDEVSDTISSLIPYMEKEHKFFWLSILDYNYHLQKDNNHVLNLIHMLCTGINSPKFNINNNNYLMNESSYERLKRNLTHANITFVQSDMLNLPEKFKGQKYDLIALSNILDYLGNYWGNNWEYDCLEDFMKSLEIITEENAVIFIKYIINYYNGKKVRNMPLFKDSSVCKSDISDEIIWIPDNSQYHAMDGIILRRVKTKQ